MGTGERARAGVWAGARAEPPPRAPVEAAPGPCRPAAGSPRAPGSSWAAVGLVSAEVPQVGPKLSARPTAEADLATMLRRGCDLTGESAAQADSRSPVD